MIRAWAALALVMAASACNATDEELCGVEPGSVLCGYCKEDRLMTGNPHAGTCRFCPEGRQCLGDVCGELDCGACATCDCPEFSTCTTCGGTRCQSASCGGGGWCCPGACDLSACGCR